MNDFKCFSSRLAGYLRQQGFKIKGIETNLKRPQFDVFLFEDTADLRAAVNKYCRK